LARIEKLSFFSGGSHMTNAVRTQAGIRHADMFQPDLTINGKPPYLTGQGLGSARISSAAREEVRLATQELKGWESAYDCNSIGSPDRYQAEIRLAEIRLHAALLSM
jgi:hypothetical protein